MNISSDNVKSILMVAGVVFVGYKIYQIKQVAGEVADVIVDEATTTFNPASDENFIYGGTQAAGHALGKWFYGVTH